MHPRPVCLCLTIAIACLVSMTARPVPDHWPVLPGQAMLKPPKTVDESEEQQVQLTGIRVLLIVILPIILLFISAIVGFVIIGRFVCRPCGGGGGGGGGCGGGGGGGGGGGCMQRRDATASFEMTPRRIPR